MNKPEHGHKPIKTESTGRTPSKELAELKKGIAHLKKKCEIRIAMLKKHEKEYLEIKAYELSCNAAIKYKQFELVLADLNQITKPADMGKVDDVL